MALRLYTFWRSQAAYRVRIALAIKGLSYDSEYIDLLKGRQFDDAYARLNPGHAVPTLVDGDSPPLTESVAIIEYLEEMQPEPPLLPSDRRLRAHARAIAQMFVADTHPFIVPRVRKYLEKELGLDEAARTRWLRHWQETGARAVETVLSRDSRTGKFCVGDRPTLADLCLVPHFTSAMMLYDCDLGAFPTCRRIFDACMALDAFASTHPTKQPDYAPH
ncbi:MAG TPA: maleylacetoacetate isomerase [Propylenella sp.]